MWTQVYSRNCVQEWRRSPTTTMDLLLRLYEPTGGEILLDGAPLTTVDAATTRATIGVVSTEAAVFRGTLAENVR